MEFVLARKMFGEQICRAHIPLDLANLDRARPDFFLHPQGVRFQVPELAQSRARRDPQGDTGIGPDLDPHLQAKVQHDGLVSEARPGGLNQHIEFRLPR